MLGFILFWFFLLSSKQQDFAELCFVNKGGADRVGLHSCRAGGNSSHLGQEVQGEQSSLQGKEHF